GPGSAEGAAQAPSARAPHGGQGNCRCYGERKMHGPAPAEKHRAAARGTGTCHCYGERKMHRASEKAHEPLPAANAPPQPVAKAQASASGPFTH
ncbi:hypothetical protein, partial [Pantoea sp.]|uniref:hypothetical protein n=1 Tax=Pantoea sp. TaxID=69393 RepID=UPI0031D1736B